MRRPAIRLHIERVVLEGIELPPSDAVTFERALSAELTVSLAAAAPGRGVAVESLAGGDVAVDARPRGHSLGRDAGRAVAAAVEGVGRA